MKDRAQTLGVVGFWVVASLVGPMIDGTTTTAHSPEDRPTAQTIELSTEFDLGNPARSDCYEDEALVMVVSSFDGRAPFVFDPGEIVCAPYDDINKGRMVSDGQ